MFNPRVVRLFLVCFVIMSLVLVEVGCQGPTKPVRAATQVILVRHAEKAGESGDVPLTERGHQRAGVLAEMLSEANVKAIFATQFQRNQMTAGPLSEKTGVPVTTIPITGGVAGHAEELAAKIQSGDFEDGAVVYVGHSNTIAPVLNALGIYSFAGEAEYPQMFVVVLHDNIPPKLMIFHYN
ncbi:MAG: histidine phosphatase family protein [Planctomycetes bacterium]|nr:histidine phosphatase family protein [Planctomycetota bacterium]